ncbi:hypothetical protein Tco_0199121 [Tanacetum coccineum]
MTTLAEHIIVAGAENRPPMLEKSMYDSWASRIRLFIKGKKNGRMMLDSIDNGPLVYPTVEENGQTRPKKYSELTEAQQLQDDCDVQATNIILHGLPPDVYALVNHQEAAKDIWDRVKLLMKGTELSYQERECRLYNLFDKFASVQGETLYEYYWRFSQLINDMHTIGMTMQQVQVNTKFLNALPPEWSKFVTDVKLAKSLYTTNYDQLYAYLSQHERHANEVRIMRERYPDPLALVANSQTLYNPSQSPQHSVPTMHPPPQQFTPVYAVPIHHQHHHTTVNPLQQSVSPQPFISPSVTQQPQAEFPQLDSGLAVPTFQQGEDLSDYINNAMAFLSTVALRFPPSNNQLRTSSNPRNLATIQDGRVTVQQIQRRQTQSLTTFQTKDLDAYDSDCDDLSSAKAVLMENLSSCDSDVLSQGAGIQDTNSSAPNDLLVLSLVEQMTDHVANLDKENQTNKMVNESLTADLERYKERVAIFEQRQNVDLSKREKLIDSQMDDLIRNRNAKLAAFQQEIDTLKETLSTHVKENESLSKTLTMYRSTQAMHMLTKPQVFYDNTHKQALGYQNPFNLRKAQRIKPTLYDGSVIAKEHDVIFMIDDEETLILEEESRSKMLDKQNDLILIVFLQLIIQKQAFWLKHSNYNPDTSVKLNTPVRYEAPSKLPKCFVDKNDFETQIKQLRIDNDQLLNQIMSQEIMHIAMISVDILNVNMSCMNECCKCLELESELLKKKDFFEKESQENDTVIRKLKEKIKSLSGKETVENVKKDIDELETINIKPEHSVTKLLSENENLRKEQEHLKSIYKDQFDSIKKIRVQSKEHSDSLIAQINAKKSVVDTVVLKHSAVTIAPGMYKLDIESISHRLKNNRDAHEDYLKKIIENTDTLCDIVECARNQNPSEPLLDYAYRYTKHIHELLVYVSLTCPIAPKLSERSVVVTPMNKDKRVRFTNPITSSSNVPKQTNSLKSQDSNKPLLQSTGVNCSTSASGSKPLGNTKNNRISQSASSNKTLKVEDHSKSIKFRKNKKNHVDKTECTADIMQYV